MKSKSLTYLLFIASFLILKTYSEDFNRITVKVYIGNSSATLLSATSLNNATKITELIIEGEHIPILKKESFEGLNNINGIVVRKTNLRYIEPHVFKNLYMLRQLNLSFNIIQEVTDNVFSNLKVSKISLRGNGIRTLSSKAFNNLPNLRVLDLGMNKIEDIPKNLFSNTGNLRVLDLSNNKLRHYPAIPYRPYSYFEQAFANAVKEESTVLDLSFNNFTFISYYLLRGIHSIGELNLNDNKINLISEYAFDDLKSLKKLNVANNRLQKLSDTLLFVLEASEEIQMEKNPWKNDFVCKYTRWCTFFRKPNTIDDLCIERGVQKS